MYLSELSESILGTFDYSTGILTYVDVNFTEYRRRMDNKAVRRNVTLPNWLNAEAEKAQIILFSLFCLIPKNMQ